MLGELARTAGARCDNSRACWGERWLGGRRSDGAIEKERVGVYRPLYGNDEWLSSLARATSGSRDATCGLYKYVVLKGNPSRVAGATSAFWGRASTRTGPSEGERPGWL